MHQHISSHQPPASLSAQGGEHPPQVIGWIQRPSWITLVGIVTTVGGLAVSPWLACVGFIPLAVDQESGRVTLTLINGTLWVTPASRLAKLLGRTQPPPKPATTARFERAQRRALQDHWFLDGNRISVSRFRRRRMRRLLAAASANGALAA